MPKDALSHFPLKIAPYTFKLLDIDVSYIGCFRNLVSTAYMHEGWFFMHAVKNDVIAVDFISFVRLIAFLLHD